MSLWVVDDSYDRALLVLTRNPNPKPYLEDRETSQVASSDFLNFQASEPLRIPSRVHLCLLIAYL